MLKMVAKTQIPQGGKDNDMFYNEGSAVLGDIRISIYSDGVEEYLELDNPVPDGIGSRMFPDSNNPIPYLLLREAVLRAMDSE